MSISFRELRRRSESLRHPGGVEAATALAVVTMFNLFKRSAPVPAKPAAKPAAPQASRLLKDVALTPLPEEASLPEVVEGNEHTDWALWEDSMTVLDSQMQGLTPSARIYERDKQTPSAYQDLDPFSQVRKKGR